eukprot:scaffold38901_cov66-Phaeocystis_antarctica.AAC.5
MCAHGRELPALETPPCARVSSLKMVARVRDSNQCRSSSPTCTTPRVPRSASSDMASASEVEARSLKSSVSTSKSCGVVAYTSPATTASKEPSLGLHRTAHWRSCVASATRAQLLRTEVAQPTAVGVSSTSAYAWRRRFLPKGASAILRRSRQSYRLSARTMSSGSLPVKSARAAITELARLHHTAPTALPSAREAVLGDALGDLRGVVAQGDDGALDARLLQSREQVDDQRPHVHAEHALSFARGQHGGGVHQRPLDGGRRELRELAAVSRLTAAHIVPLTDLAVDRGDGTCER